MTLIACPCALGLAAPLAVWSALGNAAGQRVLFRSGEALERLAEIAAIRFDKTGTLTTGSATVAECIVEHADDLETSALAVPRALAAASSHAMSRAIVEFARARQIAQVVDSWEVRVVAGLGVIGTPPASHSSIVLGSRRLLNEQGFQLGPVAIVSGWRCRVAGACQSALVGWDGQARGLFVFDEMWRPAAFDVIHWLTRAGLDVAVLTGDHAAAAGHRAATRRDRRGRADAGAKGRRDRAGSANAGAGGHDRRRHQRRPALSASDVGIALGCGTDLSRDSASICLLGDDLSRIPWSIELARRTRRVIRWNLVWAFGYNSVGVACAALGWLNPALAAFLMVASGILVTINSLAAGPTVRGRCHRCPRDFANAVTRFADTPLPCESRVDPSPSRRNGNRPPLEAAPR